MSKQARQNRARRIAEREADRAIAAAIQGAAFRWANDQANRAAGLPVPASTDAWGDAR